LPSITRSKTVWGAVEQGDEDVSEYAVERNTMGGTSLEAREETPLSPLSPEDQ